MKPNPCYGCPTCPVEVGWNPLACPERDFDTCIEFRMRPIVREQWIFEQAPKPPCPGCGSSRDQVTIHPDHGYNVRSCAICDHVFGPLEASPLENARHNVHLWGRTGTPIARELLRGCTTSGDLATKLGYDFVPFCETEEGSEMYRVGKAMLARGVPVATVLAMLGGWV
jgi:hypothetical protein